jgi:hypothetical protein
MLIADVVKVRLEIERRIGAVLDSIELLSQTRVGGRGLGDFVLELAMECQVGRSSPRDPRQSGREFGEI